MSRRVPENQFGNGRARRRRKRGSPDPMSHFTTKHRYPHLGVIRAGFSARSGKQNVSDPGTRGGTGGRDRRSVGGRGSAQRAAGTPMDGSGAGSGLSHGGNKAKSGQPPGGPWQSDCGKTLKEFLSPARSRTGAAQWPRPSVIAPQPAPGKPAAGRCYRFAKSRRSGFAFRLNTAGRGRDRRRLSPRGRPC